MTHLREMKVIPTGISFESEQVKSSKSAYDIIRKFYGDDIEVYESSFILLLNQSNKAIGYAKISQGGITGTVIDVRIILKYALDTLATGIILAHNHPSGNMQPSGSDKDITDKLKRAAGFFDIKVLDHLIIGVDGYYSMSDEGNL